MEGKRAFEQIGCLTYNEYASHEFSFFRIDRSRIEDINKMKHSFLFIAILIPEIYLIHEKVHQQYCSHFPLNSLIIAHRA